MRKKETQSSTNKKHKKILPAAIILFALLLSGAIFLSMKILNSPYVYSGVYLDGVHLGGLSEEKLTEYLQIKYETDLSSMEVSIFHKSYPSVVNFADLKVKINNQATFNQIYDSGRKGNLFQRLKEVYRLHKEHTYLQTEVSIDANTLALVVEDVYNKTYVPASSHSLLLLEEGVFLQSGQCGYAVNKELLKERIVEQVKQLKSGTVIVPVQEVLPERVDVDSFYNQIIQDSRDASFELSNGELRIIPEITGRALDKATFLSSVAELEAKSGKYPFELKVPVETTPPKRTAEILEEALFRDELGKYKTVFPLNTDNDKARAVNIRIATQAIDGTILLPGDTFSFNEIVGKRTMERGYQKAIVYSVNGISTGVGGGICQVSTTLYNAGLLANLQIDERNAHFFTVAYVPPGRDSAVSYGIEDYRFTNNTNWPLKINGKISNDEVIFTLTGTDEDPDLEVILQTSVLKTIPFEKKTVVDKTLSKGSSVVVQPGSDGAVVDTFYTLKRGKDIISSYKLHTTSYKALPEITNVAPK
ncbi:MAG: VanW family protein [Thermoclostridium sp.]|nr:VanW family protein [Thermoclostridium sp.]